MVDLSLSKTNPQQQFWEQLEDSKAVMLGLMSPADGCLQPMAPLVDRETGRIWFYAKKTSKLVLAVGEGHRAQLVLIGQNQDYHACVSGTLEQIYDREVIDRFWSVVASAWFENGKDDPDLIMLRFSPHDAEIWASSTNAIVFGWEIAKANMSSSDPDIGLHERITF